MTIENLYYIKHLFSSIIAFFNLKFLTVLFLSVMLYSTGDDKLQLAQSLFILVMIDFSMAILTAYRTGIDIQSSKILRTGIKLAVYFMLLAAAHISEPASALGFLDETMFAFLTLTELISILEHASDLGFSIPRAILNQIRQTQENK